MQKSVIYIQQILLLICACVYATHISKSKQLLVNNIEESEANHIIYSTGAGAEDEYGGSSGFSQGSGLRAIAQGSAELANTAFLNQHTAAKQAAFAAKSSLAQAAIGASATARAALVGKQILLQRLEQEFQEAEQQLQSEILQLEQAQRAAASAQNLAHLAQTQLNSIAIAINAAHGTVLYATEAANAAVAEVGSQASMVGEAKRKISTIAEQLDSARIDYDATEAAARQASEAAELAQSNAQNAAEKASSANAENELIGAFHILPLSFSHQ